MARWRDMFSFILYEVVHSLLLCFHKFVSVDGGFVWKSGFVAVLFVSIPWAPKKRDSAWSRPRTMYSIVSIHAIVLCAYRVWLVAIWMHMYGVTRVI